VAGASKFVGTENGADCSKCGGTVAVLFKTRNGTSLTYTLRFSEKCGIENCTQNQNACFS